MSKINNLLQPSRMFTPLLYWPLFIICFGKSRRNAMLLFPAKLPSMTAWALPGPFWISEKANSSTSTFCKHSICSTIVPFSQPNFSSTLFPHLKKLNKNHDNLETSVQHNISYVTLSVFYNRYQLTYSLHLQCILYMLEILQYHFVRLLAGTVL